MNQEKIGEFIAQKRKEKGLTQEELAYRLNVSNKTISRWETGKNLPDLSLFQELSEILGVSVNDLMSGYIVDKKEYQEKFEQNIVNTIDKVEKNNKYWQIGGNIVISILSILLVILLTNITLDTITIPIKEENTTFEVKEVSNTINIKYENVYNGIQDYVVTKDESENIIIFISLKQSLKNKIQEEQQEKKKHNLIEEKYTEYIRITSNLFKENTYQIYYTETNLKKIRQASKERLNSLKEESTLIYEKK